MGLNGRMSTIDPVAQRTLRRNRPPRPIAIVVALALHLVGGFAMGYGWSGFFSAFQAPIEELTAPPVITNIAIVVGLPLTIGGAIAWLSLAMKRADLQAFHGAAVFCLGAAVGVLLASVEFGLPLLLIPIGVAFLGLAVLFLALAARAGSLRTRRLAREESIMHTGTLTTATVSDKGYVIFRESTRIFTTVTFTFTDLHGAQRWVQRRMVVRAEDPVAEGQQTELWYDPSDPGNDGNIVVKLAVDSPIR